MSSEYHGEYQGDKPAIHRKCLNEYKFRGNDGMVERWNAGGEASTIPIFHHSTKIMLAGYEK
jgi:hypothetical protein